MDVREKLINANELLNSIRDDYNINGANFAKIRRHIEAAPAVEDVEVVHGRWIKVGYACGETEWQCSACKETEWRTSASRLKYCPFCGAKMDLEG